MHYLKPRLAKLPLPPDETARIHRYRGMLDNAVDMINEIIVLTHAKIIRQAEAEERAAAQQAVSPSQAKPQPQKPRPAKPENPTPQPASPTPELTLRPRKGAKPEVVLLHLVRAMEACMRLDSWYADRLAHAHTTAELAGLNHPNRQPILDYMHKMVRFEEPYPFQRTTHDSIETRITEELAWAPNRNPADIIVEICTHLNIPFDPADFPNNWRPSPKQDPPPKPREDPDFNDPAAAEEFYKTVQTEMENRRLRGLDE